MHSQKSSKVWNHGKSPTLGFGVLFTVVTYNEEQVCTFMKQQVDVEV